ncbi:MAG: hypothetical protein WD335_00825 [Candidatus Paceibacterota bacterium]
MTVRRVAINGLKDTEEKQIVQTIEVGLLFILECADQVIPDTKLMEAGLEDLYPHLEWRTARILPKDNTPECTRSVFFPVKNGSKSENLDTVTECQDRLNGVKVKTTRLKMDEVAKSIPEFKEKKKYFRLVKSVRVITLERKNIPGETYPVK